MGGKLMRMNHKYVGMDVHKESNVETSPVVWREVAIAQGNGGEVRLYGS
jgi:hypothetical protein